MILRLVSALCALVGLGAETVSAERIINKADADHIFSINIKAWNAYAEQMIHPGGWKIQLSHHDTGSGIMAFDPKTGMGMSIQPLYHDEVSPPDMLIVGSFYPRGSLPAFSNDFKAKLESEAMKDLGNKYSVSARRADISQWEGIELMLSRR